MGTTTHPPLTRALARLGRWLHLMPGAPTDNTTPEWVHPYPASTVPDTGVVAAEIDAETARLAGERFRREYTPLFGESVAATGTDPGGCAGVEGSRAVSPARCARMVAAMCDADGIYRQGVTYGDYPVGMRHRMNVTITDLQDLATKADEQS